MSERDYHMYNLKFQEVMGFLMGSDASEDRLGICCPSLDVYETPEGLNVEIEIPGVDNEEVNVEVLGNLLRISGAKKDPLTNKGVRYLRMERSFGRFERELEIPDRFDLDKIAASFRDGVLNIRIGKAESKVEMVKRIEIE